MRFRPKIFYAKRQLRYGTDSERTNWVSVAGTPKLLKRDPGDVCLKYFLKAFGFTPLKGRVYKVTVGTFTVEEV